MRLRTGLQAALAYVLLLAIVAFGIPLALSLKTRVNDEVRSQARGQADLVAATASDLLGASHRSELATVARTAGAAVRGRVLIVDAKGVVIADSSGGGELGVSYMARPEIARALAGKAVQFQRESRTLGQQILATAVPTIHNGATVGAVRITQSVASVHSAVARVELGLGLIGIVVLALGLAAGGLIAARIARPLGRLERVAREVAAGDLTARAPIEGSREQRSLSASFNEMTSRVRDLLEAQRRFVADASHQLRTPLTGLRLRLEEGLAADVSPAAETQLRAGVGEVERLAEIIDELLLLSGSGERPAAGERVQLGAVATRALERWRGTAADRGMRLELDVGAAGTVWCPTADADRALDVLIENALAYTPEGGEVLLRALARRIEVLDTGPGLTPADERSVFERFHRGSAAQGGPAGSGLGLAIARELARGWGGEITLSNRPEGGAAAVLTFTETA